ncbi:MAG: IclR family transcriptional regulator [Alphaproteobacteria bacterium]|nr:IclR family transcriptional regulator [Alphaproteobacteria bacterium]
MKSLSKALRVFCAFEAGQPLGVTEISQRCGLSKGQVSKILQVFRSHELLHQDPKTRRYRISLRAFMLGSAFVNRHPLASASLPSLRRLVDRAGHSATLSVLDRGRVAHLLAVEGPLFLDARWRVGRAITYHVAASARVLLASAPPEEVEQIMAEAGLPALTPRTITDPDCFRQHLAGVRERGFDVSRSEGVPGLGAIAVPVFGAGGRTIASLSLIFPEHTVPEAGEAELIAALHAAARTISVRMGADIYPFGGLPPRPTKPKAAPRKRAGSVTRPAERA